MLRMPTACGLTPLLTAGTLAFSCIICLSGHRIDSLPQFHVEPVGYIMVSTSTAHQSGGDAVPVHWQLGCGTPNVLHMMLRSHPYTPAES